MLSLLNISTFEATKFSANFLQTWEIHVRILSKAWNLQKSLSTICPFCRKRFYTFLGMRPIRCAATQWEWLVTCTEKQVGSDDTFRLFAELMTAGGLVREISKWAHAVGMTLAVWVNWGHNRSAKLVMGHSWVEVRSRTRFQGCSRQVRAMPAVPFPRLVRCAGSWAAVELPWRKH